MKRRKTGSLRLKSDDHSCGTSNIPPLLWEAFRRRLFREGHSVTEFLRRCCAAYTEGRMPFPQPPTKTWRETASSRFREGNRWGTEIEVSEEYEKVEAEITREVSHE